MFAAGKQRITINPIIWDAAYVIVILSLIIGANLTRAELK